MFTYCNTCGKKISIQRETQIGAVNCASCTRPLHGSLSSPVPQKRFEITRQYFIDGETA